MRIRSIAKCAKGAQRTQRSLAIIYLCVSLCIYVPIPKYRDRLWFNLSANNYLSHIRLYGRVMIILLKINWAVEEMVLTGIAHREPQRIHEEPQRSFRLVSVVLCGLKKLQASIQKSDIKKIAGKISRKVAMINTKDAR